LTNQSLGTFLHRNSCPDGIAFSFCTSSHINSLHIFQLDQTFYILITYRWDNPTLCAARGVGKNMVFTKIQVIFSSSFRLFILVAHCCGKPTLCRLNRKRRLLSRATSNVMGANNMLGCRQEKGCQQLQDTSNNRGDQHQ